MATKSVKKSSSSSSSDIPREIIEIILLKLPSIKSLLRCKAVSKSWNTIISDPLFMQNHLQSSNNSPNNNLFITSYIHNNEHPGFPLVKFEDGGKVRAGEVFVENIPNGYNRILCECNGVLLLTNLYLPNESKYDRYTLWNPSTRREMFLINQCDLNEGYIVDYGICYDQITSDFKVIFIFLRKYAIYSCNNNSWTKKPGRKYHTMGGTGLGLFVDGATYWILGDNTNRSGRQLVYFDPRTDELKVLQRPEKVNNHDKYLLVNMGRLSGRVCLYCYNKVTQSVQMWIKEKGIDSGENRTNYWKEFITVENFNPPYLWSRPIFFVEKKVVFQTRNNKIAFYSPNENTVEEILAMLHGIF